MSQVRFLVDESLRLSLVAALRRAEPAMDVWRVGQAGMPAFGSPDPELLTFCDREKRLLVSLDRALMPDHVAAPSRRRAIDRGRSARDPPLLVPTIARRSGSDLERNRGRRVAAT